MILRNVIGDRVTLQKFDVGGGRGTWRGSPFKEIEVVVPDIPVEVKTLRPMTNTALGIIWNSICNSIEDSWSPNHFHVIFHSSGYDSRIISGAIKRLVSQRGEDWLSPGLLFLSNRWEATPFRAIMSLQEWDRSLYTAYDRGPSVDHFSRSLDFNTFWHTTNAPTPSAGNLRWYLIDWAQGLNLLPSDDQLQVYTGLWANETWDSLLKKGMKEWVDRHNRWYCYNQMAALPWKADRVEYPLSDVNVLKGVLALGKGNGTDWRRRLSEIASLETVRIARDGQDDWKRPVSGGVIRMCRHSYADSWYAKNVKGDWTAPMSSHWSNGWGEYGLASLCEALVRDGVEVVV